MRTTLLFLRLRRTLATLALCVLPAVAQAQATVSSTTSTPASQGSSTADYMLRPADILQIKVFQEEDLTREVSVSREYAISLPLVGTVDLKNKSVRQA